MGLFSNKKEVDIFKLFETSASFAKAAESLKNMKTV